MVGESDMLRMLEPAVRPMGTPARPVQSRPPVDQQSFEQLLSQAHDATVAPTAMKLSAHAQDRLSEMGVALTDAQMRAIGHATDKAEAKGSRDSLLLLKQLGLIVNVPNRTVITAVNAQRMNDGVITQIDSTVFVDESHDERLHHGLDH